MLASSNTSYQIASAFVHMIMTMIFDNDSKSSFISKSYKIKERILQDLLLALLILFLREETDSATPAEHYISTNLSLSK